MWLLPTCFGVGRANVDTGLLKPIRDFTHWRSWPWIQNLSFENYFVLTKILRVEWPVSKWRLTWTQWCPDLQVSGPCCSWRCCCCPRLPRWTATSALGMVSNGLDSINYNSIWTHLLMGTFIGYKKYRHSLSLFEFVFIKKWYDVL